MSRVPLADFEPALKKRLEALWGAPPNLYRALGNHPQLVAAWNEFSKVLRHDTRTPRALRELVILRGGQLMRSEYEWAQHLPMARKAGVTEARLCGFQCPPRRGFADGCHGARGPRVPPPRGGI